LMEMDGAAMVGTKIKAPFGLVPEVYVLPMDNVLATEVGYRCRHVHTLRFPRRLRKRHRSAQKVRIQWYSEFSSMRSPFLPMLSSVACPFQR
ncbi:hypothetical protein M405DRAFT_826921, partial [Rhizopogon salebrosus TDB-379]